jgi:hypothetical protein
MLFALQQGAVMVLLTVEGNNETGLCRVQTYQ